MCIRDRDYGLRTIGDIALSSPQTLHTLLGKNGDTLYACAAGLDQSPVMPLIAQIDAKSVGNSTTPPFDITDETDARRVLFLLSDSVAARLREQQLRCRTIALWIRSVDLDSCERQLHLPCPTDLSAPIMEAAWQLLRQTWDMRSPLLSLIHI